MIVAKIMYQQFQFIFRCNILSRDIETTCLYVAFWQLRMQGMELNIPSPCQSFLNLKTYIQYLTIIFNIRWSKQFCAIENMYKRITKNPQHLVLNLLLYNQISSVHQLEGNKGIICWWLKAFRQRRPHSLLANIHLPNDSREQ